ncbi:MAG: L-threonylcarbamoyladenylate synthase, partial [Halobacteriaceae archaeon]
MTPTDDISNATDAIQSGELVVYPTETVYGLGADALDPDAIENVYEVKSRSRDNPISLAVPSIEEALTVTSP